MGEKARVGGASADRQHPVRVEGWVAASAAQIPQYANFSDYFLECDNLGNVCGILDINLPWVPKLSNLRVLTSMRQGKRSVMHESETSAGLYPEQQTLVFQPGTEGPAT